MKLVYTAAASYGGIRLTKEWRREGGNGHGSVFDVAIDHTPFQSKEFDQLDDLLEFLYTLDIPRRVIQKVINEWL